jgi:hypothetical protein
MKQKDLALVLVVVFVSVVVSLVVSRMFFGSPKNREQKAEVVDVISPEFSLPPTKYFNAKAVNPTQQIQIGDSNNPNPFNTKPE